MNPRPNTRATGRTRGFGLATVQILGLGILAACQSTRMAVAEKENGLSAAGFVVHRADTPERQSLVSLLPANQIAWYQRSGAFHYVYADPRGCSCLYVGTQEAYEKWVSYAHEHHAAAEKPVRAELYIYPDAAWNWGTGGPRAPYPGFDPIPPDLDK